MSLINYRFSVQGICHCKKEAAERSGKSCIERIMLEASSSFRITRIYDIPHMYRDIGGPSEDGRVSWHILRSIPRTSQLVNDKVVVQQPRSSLAIGRRTCAVAFSSEAPSRALIVRRQTKGRWCGGVNAGLNCEVNGLKKKIKEEAVHGTLKDVDSYALELWKPKDSNPIATRPADTLSERIGSQGGLSKFADKLDPTDNVFCIFSMQPQSHRKNIDIIVQAPATDWKIPLSHFKWKKLLQGEELPDHACCDQDLELLFNQCEDETADRILDESTRPGGTEGSLHGFWDANIGNILVQCLSARSVRNGNHGTESGQLRPNFGLLLDKVCVFRGEEKREFYTGKHPKDELKNKTRWVYDPAPYVLGWLLRHWGQCHPRSYIAQEDGCLRVVDLITTDLSSRRERIKNASRMIKVYGLEGEVDGKDRVENLMAIYASLVSKGVLTWTDLRKLKFSTMYMVHTSIWSQEALMKALNHPRMFEMLSVAHAHPSLFHRDIRWPNIMQSREDSSKWFLIDWEDASFAPNKSSTTLEPYRTFTKGI
ncbi:hypothetical protein F5887DRAFT_1232886 [Amanita rubescens]|nr:hypothetical protein F5887DRAFT_1232886 [Amanita rubescens]